MPRRLQPVAIVRAVALERSEGLPKLASLVNLYLFHRTAAYKNMSLLYCFCRIPSHRSKRRLVVVLPRRRPKDCTRHGQQSLRTLEAAVTHTVLVADDNTHVRQALCELMAADFIREIRVTLECLTERNASK